MKNAYVIIFTIGLLLVSCGDKRQEAAELLLETAKTHLEQGKLEEARADLDSLRKQIPSMSEDRDAALKLKDIRKEALKLHQDIELKIAQQELALTDSLLQVTNRDLEQLQQQVEAHKKALKATPEELTDLTKMRVRRDSIRTQFETLGAKIRYIHQKQKE